MLTPNPDTPTPIVAVAAYDTACAKVGELVCEVAAATNAACVAMARHGKGTLRELVTGSVTNYCVHHCSSPVVVINVAAELSAREAAVGDRERAPSLRGCRECFLGGSAMGGFARGSRSPRGCGGKTRHSFSHVWVRCFRFVVATIFLFWTHLQRSASPGANLLHASGVSALRAEKVPSTQASSRV